MTRFTRLLLLLPIGAAGCSTQTSNWNNHIDAASRTQIERLNKEVVAAFYENKPQKLQAVFSPELQAKSGAEAAGLVDKMHAHFATPAYEVLDECKTAASPGQPTTIPSNTTSTDAYWLRVQPVTSDTYIALLTSGNDTEKTLLACIYGNYSGSWKLQGLRLGTYSLFGQNAVDFYEKAQADYQAGNLLNAANDIGMIERTAMPAGDVFQYQKDAEMRTFAHKVIAEANQRFPMPMTVAAVKSAPQIFRLSPVAISEGIFPEVDYLSRISLQDTAALRQENTALQQAVATALPGLTTGHKLVVFKAYNQLPGNGKSVPTYGFLMRPAQP